MERLRERYGSVAVGRQAIEKIVESRTILACKPHFVVI